MIPALNALVYFIACFGLSWIITEAAITYNIRSYFYERSKTSKLFSLLFDLTNCIVCTSWWVALFSLITPYPYEIFRYQSLWMYLYLPFCVSGLIVVWLQLTGELNDD